MTDAIHVPVLQRELLDLLRPKPDGVVLDGTVGGGGHAEALLMLTQPNGRLLGLDLDERALEQTRKRLAPFGDRVLLVKANYRDAAEVVAAHPDFQPVSSILLDLGFSSIELEESGRGFSFLRSEEPLDMRYDPAAGEPTAAVLLATLGEPELARIIRDFGEEPLAKRIARSIAERRTHHPIETVDDLVSTVLSAYGRRHYSARSRQHPATRTFQALRIAVNRELETLEAALPSLAALLAPSGRIAVISFHSLEDRIVKQFFRNEARGCICPPELPVCRCGHEPRLKIITRHPITPGAEEQTTNPRSRSAKLRVAEKTSR